jgi:hypothetical protein
VTVAQREQRLRTTDAIRVEAHFPQTPRLGG